jgi:hypothetical protein
LKHVTAGILALTLIAFAIPAKAQARFQLGGFGTGAWNNYQAGALGILEQPLGKRLEIHLTEGYSFYENKPGYGKGVANVFRVGTTIWLNDRIGLNASGEESGYTLNSLSKGAIYAWAGPVFRIYMFKSPSRLQLGYVTELDNGLTPTGLETSHLKAGLIAISTRVGCSGPFCFRINYDFTAGTVLDQGNPVCDGSRPGPVTCPRSMSGSGGFKASFTLEFPRPRGNENNLS